MALIQQNLSKFAHRGFGEPEPFTSLLRTYNRRILDFSQKKEEFGYLNTICSDGKKYLLIGTEHGIIYVFSLLANRFIASFRSDKWINSLRLASHKVYSVGLDRIIRSHFLKSQKLCFAISTSADEEAFGAKGVKIYETSFTGKLIANIGFGRFAVLDPKKNKVIFRFEVSKGSTGSSGGPTGRSSSTTVLNYCVVKSSFLLFYLIEDNEHLFFFDYKQRRLEKKIRVFEMDKLVRKNVILVNSLLLEEDWHIFMVLQFSMGDRERSNLITVLYVFEVSEKPGTDRVRELFQLKLSSEGSPRYERIHHLQARHESAEELSSVFPGLLHDYGQL